MIDIKFTNDSSTQLTSIVYTGDNAGTLVYANLTPEQKIKVDSFLSTANSLLEVDTCNLAFNTASGFVLDFIYESGSSCTNTYVILCDVDCLDFSDKVALDLFIELLN